MKDADSRPGTLERAFQLAQSGTCKTVEEIRKRLRMENYLDVSPQLSSRALKIQLRRLCAQAAPTDQSEPG